MSFSVSSLSSGNFTVSLSGTRGIASETVGADSNLYYSTNSGATWTLATGGSILNVGINSINLSGLFGVAAGITSGANAVVYYSTNGGQSWTLSSAAFPLIATPFQTLASNSGSNIILGINNGNDCAVYYSTNNGVSFSLGFLLATVVSESVRNVAINGTTLIAVTQEGANSVIRNSLDSGSTWNIRFTQAFLTGSSLSLSGTNALFTAGSAGNGFIRYSSDSGSTWNIPTSTPLLTSVNLVRVSISGSVGMIGGNASGNSFIWYTSDGGNNWSSSTFSQANTTIIASISASGTNGLIAINTSVAGTGVLYYSTNSGVTWTLANSYASTNLNNGSLDGSRAIVGTSSGIYYTSTPLCYEANTLILTVENDEEVYKKVSELKVGDLVKTYKRGNKMVKLLRSFKYKPLNKDNNLNFLYRMKENGVILTAGHSILVDELTEEEKSNNAKYRFSQTIEDKKLLLACSSNRFEKIDDDLEYELCHFALENDNVTEHYGVYINDGILSESCSEAALLKML
jgi:photosystem II stability/assembly factor-like uncharacterized protein